VQAGLPTTGIDFQLAAGQAGSISGQVNSFGAPLPNVSVTATAAGGAAAPAVQTGADGRYSIANLAPNHYTVRVQAPVQRDARDLSINGHHYIVLGYYESGGYGGPNMSSNHSWATSAITPQRLVGVPEASLSAAQRSTLKTVLPTVREECGMRFDVSNAWDFSTLSIPLFHWTLGSPPRPNAATQIRGELLGWLAFLRHADRALFERAIGFFGISTERNWPLPALQAKFEDAVTHRRAGEAGLVTVPETRDDYAYLRSWHWFYRFVMAARTFGSWQRRLWDMVRFRLRDIRAAPWGAGVANLGNGNAPTIGDVYTSELALGMLLRWHVYRPGHVVAGGGNAQRAGAELREAFDRARADHPGLNWATAPDAWNNDHEEALIDGLENHVASNNVPANIRANMPGAFQDVQNFRFGAQGLDNARNSLDFDEP
jgi:hypothetical protein